MQYFEQYVFMYTVCACVVWMAARFPEVSKGGHSPYAWFLYDARFAIERLRPLLSVRSLVRKKILCCMHV